MSDQARSCEDYNPTVESVSKVLVKSAQAPIAHSDFQKEDVLASPDGGLGIGCDSKQFTTNLKHCISPMRKAKKTCIVKQCEDEDGANLSGESDDRMSMEKGETPSGAGAPSHDSLSEASDLENSALDLFESFLANDSSETHMGSTVSSENCGDRTDSIVKLEECGELTDCSEGLVTHEAHVHSSEGLVTNEAHVHSSEGLVNREVDCTDASVLDAGPCASSLACGRGDSSESLAVPQVSGLNSDPGITAHRQTTWNAMTTLPSGPCPQLDVNDITVFKVDTGGSFSQSVILTRDALRPSRSDASFGRFTCDDIETIATDRAPMSDTIDLTDDDIAQDMPPRRSNSHQVGKSLLCRLWMPWWKSIQYVK